MGKLQSSLIKMYAALEDMDLFRNKSLQPLLAQMYFLYKRYVEDDYHLLINTHPELFRQGHILDIGAHIGYTSNLFLKRLSPGYRIFSFEPEERCFGMLRALAQTPKKEGRIVPIHSAVGNRGGVAQLWRNKEHFANHRIVANNFRGTSDLSTVPITSIDDFLESRNMLSEIKFIKIDAEGYELPICQGMTKTVEKNPNVTVGIEYYPSQIAELGFKPEGVLEYFKKRDFLLYIMDIRRQPQEASTRVINQVCQQKGYINILCAKRGEWNSSNDTLQAGQRPAY